MFDQYLIKEKEGQSISPLSFRNKLAKAYSMIEKGDNKLPSELPMLNIALCEPYRYDKTESVHLTPSHAVGYELAIRS